jgi:hypothetical protein
VDRREVALVTYAELPDGSKDDQILHGCLREIGITPVSVVWDDPAVDWARFPLCVVRSTWDYHLRRDEFVAWAERVGSVTTLWNHPRTIAWNSHKSYLRELEQKGSPVVPTVWLSPSDAGQVDLAALMSEKGWNRAVVKPAVSANSFETILVGPTNRAEGQAHIERLLPNRELMVQPFLRSTRPNGERSHMFINGQYSHSVLRPPTLDYESKSPRTPEIYSWDATGPEMFLGGHILNIARQLTLYARVDFVIDDNRAMRLLELELIEPEMFFARDPEAAARMARAIAARSPRP